MNLYIDIETMPSQAPDALDRIRETIKPPASYKKPETVAKWLEEKGEAAALDAYHKTSLNGLHGEICSVAYAVDDGPIHAITWGLDDVQSEAELLTQLWIHVTELTDEAHSLIWVGHNILEFDLRYLKQRSMVRGCKPSRFIPADARHGTGSAYDTMRAWAGWKGYVKQDDLCDALGIKSDADEGVDGSQVWQLVQDGRLDDLAEYNKLDVWKVREMFRRMEYQTAPEPVGA